MIVRIDGDRLTTFLKRYKLSHGELADRIGIHINTLTLWKREEYPLLSDISAALDCHPLMLLKVDENGVLMVDKEKFDRHIEEAGTSKSELARTFGIHRNTVNDFANSKFRTVSILGAAIGVNPMALLRFEDESNGDKGSPK